MLISINRTQIYRYKIECNVKWERKGQITKCGNLLELGLRELKLRLIRDGLDMSNTGQQECHQGKVSRYKLMAPPGKKIGHG